MRGQWKWIQCCWSNVCFCECGTFNWYDPMWDHVALCVHEWRLVWAPSLQLSCHRQKHQCSSTPLSKHLPPPPPPQTPPIVWIHDVCCVCFLLACKNTYVRWLFDMCMLIFLVTLCSSWVFFSLTFVIKWQPNSGCIEFHYNPTACACVRGNVSFDNVWFSFVSNLTLIACRPLGWCVNISVSVFHWCAFPSKYCTVRPNPLFLL